MKALSKIKDRLLAVEDLPAEDEYLEIDAEKAVAHKAKVVVKPFSISDFSEVKPALDALREGYTIALVNIKQLREKDMVELKRVVNKLKKTCDAIEGDIAGFGEDWIVVTPNFAYVDRTKEKVEEIKE